MKAIDATVLNAIAVAEDFLSLTRQNAPNATIPTAKKTYALIVTLHPFQILAHARVIL
jgi:hypothetical protein